MRPVSDLKTAKSVDDYRIDWQRVVLNLRSAVLTCAAVAARIGCKESTLKLLAAGKQQESRFSTCAALLDLHERVCTERHDIPSLMKRAKDSSLKRAA